MTLGARDALIEYIANPRTHSSLRAYARRRGVVDADDLVQTALCDALAVEAVPIEEAELPRWVTGIARHKVMDEHRRRARWKHVELPEQADLPNPEAAALLRRIDAEIVDAEQRRTLGWLVREHAGDSLCEIAREEALNPTTVRQRICRLRQQLRSRYLWPLLLALGVGAGTTLLVAQPTGTTTEHARSPLDAYLGTWRVTGIAPSEYAAMHLQVSITAESIRVFRATQAFGRELRLERMERGQITLRSGDSRWVARLERLDERRLKLTSPQGFVELERIE